MNTYKIIFTRENGTQGADHFTAINERQARKDFGECYRHSTATIISIELASTNTPATKQQERDTLEKIRKMVEQLGPDSYLATAFEGCLDHFIAVCGSFYITRDTLKIWLKLQKKVQK